MTAAWFLTLALIACVPLAQAAERGGKVLRQLGERAQQTHTSSMVVLRDGKVVAEYYASGTDPGPIELMSATKSVVALGAGLLMRDGKVPSLDVPVHQFYPEWKQGRKELITLRMLLSHTSGLQDEQTTERIYAAPDFVQFALAADLAAEPGERVFYSNKATNLLPSLIGRAAGVPAKRYFDEQLFAPLGIGAVAWDTDTVGNLQGMAGLKLSARDAAKIGQLIVQEGRWNEQQVVPADYILEMLNPSDSKAEEFGLLWFRQPSWIHLRADRESFELLRALQVDPLLIGKLEKLEGRSFDRPETFVDALASVLDRGELAALYEQLHAQGRGPYVAFHLEIGPIAAYRAEGYLGQYIVIVPQANIVGVRLIEDSDAYRDEDAYEDFPELILDYAKAVAPKRIPK